MTSWELDRDCRTRPSRLITLAGRSTEAFASLARSRRTVFWSTPTIDAIALVDNVEQLGLLKAEQVNLRNQADGAGRDVAGP